MLHDQQTEEQEKQGELEVVYEDGKLLKNQSLAEIRARLDDSLNSTMKAVEEFT